jgi:acetyl-CoA C-acetyltransferase
LYKLTDVVIVSAARTPIGTFNGIFANVPAHELGSIAIKSALLRAKIDPKDIDEVILGQILTAGQGQNPARQASVMAGVPYSVPSWGLNQLCGSGLRSVAIGYQQIMDNSAKIVIAGGQENMSLSPHCLHLRNGYKMGNINYIDTMIHDGLIDVFNGYHMGVTAENISNNWNISKSDQDNFALNSQIKASNAQDEGRFDEEICSVKVKVNREDIFVDKDEYIRKDISLDNIERLKPIFKKDGTVTAGNSSGINDGAAALVIMTYEEAQKRDLHPLAKIVSWGQAGVDPALMGSGPIPASRSALAKAGWAIEDLDLVELNEAFAAQACACAKDLQIDASKLNVNGGAIALGHPVGASGARVLTTLLFEMKRRGVQKGLAALCIGGGMGIAMCIQRHD